MIEKNYNAFKEQAEMYYITGKLTMVKKVILKDTPVGHCNSDSDAAWELHCYLQY